MFSVLRYLRSMPMNYFSQERGEILCPVFDVKMPPVHVKRIVSPRMSRCIHFTQKELSLHLALSIENLHYASSVVDASAPLIESSIECRDPPLYFYCCICLCSLVTSVKILPLFLV
ncbi:hypothetical protein V6N13_108740 [Hibiscus sabdariffa]|uniref:Uncharacterized protein n=1 Tax=Hibiscus sabdariffa TaxID=183260 RepID=A0ABR2ST21_9ROSI